MRSLLLLLLALAAPAVALEPPPLPGESLDGWEALDTWPDGPLTADAAVESAIANNGALQAQLALVDAARGRLIGARALPNPSVAVGLVDAARETEWGLHGVEAEFELSEAVLATLRTRPARAELDVARLRAAEATLRLGYEVRANVHAAQAAELRYVAAVRALDALAAGVDTARALFAAGNVPELDVAVQETEYERARIGVADLELALLVARERLSRVLGAEERSPLAPLPSPGALAVPEDVEGRAVAASLELRALDAGIEASTAAMTLTRAAGSLPEVGVFVASQPVGERWDVEAGVHVTVPLFERRRGELVALAAERSSKQATRAQTEAEVRSAAREARARVVSAWDRATHFEQVVLPARRRVSRQTLLQYNAMQIGIYQLLDARRQELEAEVTLAERLAELATAQAALDALLAGARVDPPAVRAASNPSASDAGGGH